MTDDLLKRISFKDGARLVISLAESNAVNERSALPNYIDTNHIKRAIQQFFQVFGASDGPFHFSYNRLFSKPVRESFRRVIGETDAVASAFLDRPVPAEWLQGKGPGVPFIHHDVSPQEEPDIRNIVRLATARTEEEQRREAVMPEAQHERRKRLIEGNMLSTETAMAVIVGAPPSIHELSLCAAIGGYHEWPQLLLDAQKPITYTKEEIIQIQRDLDDAKPQLKLRGRLNPDLINRLLSESDRLKLLAYRVDRFLEYMESCPLPVSMEGPHPLPTYRELLRYYS